MEGEFIHNHDPMKSFYHSLADHIPSRSFSYPLEFRKHFETCQKFDIFLHCMRVCWLISCHPLCQSCVMKSVSYHHHCHLPNRLTVYHAKIDSSHHTLTPTGTYPYPSPREQSMVPTVMCIRVVYVQI